MSERGESLGPVDVPVAPWRKLRNRLLGGRGSSGVLAVRQPNRRVQRTRSSPSAHRSPLTRYPLGSRGARGQHGRSSLIPEVVGTGEMIRVS